MNDFTKEELIEILEGLDAWYLEHSPFKIGEKIQSMIDNYKEPCEHEFIRELMQIDLCHKCKSFKFVFAGFNDESERGVNIDES